MRVYIVQYRINGGRLIDVGRYRATCPANAIAAAAISLRDIDETLDIIATPAYDHE